MVMPSSSVVVAAVTELVVARSSDGKGNKLIGDKGTIGDNVNCDIEGDS